MPTQIPALSWNPYQAGQAGTLLATVNLDSAVDTNYLVPIVGKYSNQPQVVADVVIVLNTQNNGTVVVIAGSLEIDVVPFSRDYLQLDKNIAQNIAVNFTVGTIQLQFYKGTPPINPSLMNYAGAAAVANANLFPGGVTSGTPNAQTISVATTYAFSNGILVVGTSGFKNTGPATINVNSVGAVAITKVTALGSVLLTGGELEAGSNFILAANASAGSFDLVSMVTVAPVVPQVVAMAKFDTVGTLAKAFNVSGVVKNSTGNFTITFAAAIDANAVLSAVALSAVSAGDTVVSAQSGASAGVNSFNAGGAPLDYTGYYFLAFA